MEQLEGILSGWSLEDHGKPPSATPYDPPSSPPPPPEGLEELIAEALIIANLSEAWDQYELGGIVPAKLAEGTTSRIIRRLASTLEALK